VLLDAVAQLFEPGLHHPEREVDWRLRELHPDHGSLRRHLVDEQFMDRDHNVYWRSGGHVNPSD